MNDVHPSAIVDPKAELGDGVKIGPFCVVDGDAVLGDGVVLHSHVVVTGRTRIGPGSEIYPFASIGHVPQDLKFQGEPSELVIGARNRIREHVTMNPGTEGGGLVTRVGDGCLFMVGAHVAHDCLIGDGVIMANNATLAGHVSVGDHAIIGGLSAVHQFVRIGAHAFVDDVIDDLLIHVQLGDRVAQRDEITRLGDLGQGGQEAVVLGGGADGDPDAHT